MNSIYFPPEWHEQDAIMLTLPHPDTDWNGMLPEVHQCYSGIAREILSDQKLIVISPTKQYAHQSLKIEAHPNLYLVDAPSNDTWTRDHAFLSVFVDGKPVALDFGFNGWGLKYPAEKDNCINRVIFRNAAFWSPDLQAKNRKNFVLEGGSIDTNGEGIMLTTKHCLLSPNRNPRFGQAQIERYLKRQLGIDTVLFLEHGGIEGDDTDSHIDTLARFCTPRDIAYSQCCDSLYPQYQSLMEMEKELEAIAGKYNLCLHPLPLPPPIYHHNKLLPATYANFLITNHKVLVPTYNTPSDRQAIETLAKIFPNRKAAGIDCRSLVKQNGSLHCITMQIPKGFLKHNDIPAQL